MNKSILAIGAGGFVGQRVLHALIQRGEYVITASWRHLGAAGALVDSHVGSFCEPRDYLSLLPSCRAVVHAASSSTPGSSAGHPLSELNENLQPTLALLQVLQDHLTVPLFYLSSVRALYSDPAFAPGDESKMAHPRSYHGAGKITAECLIEAWCAQFHTSATIFRPSNLYGPGQHEHAGFGIVPTAFGKVMRNEILCV